MPRLTRRPMAGPLAAILLAALTLGLPTPALGQAPPDLTDAEVAHVAVTANAIDIDLAKFAR